MKNSILISLILQLVFLQGLTAQDLTLHWVCELPDTVKESSGLETGTGGKLWTHNDSGGEACLFLADTAGNLLRRLNLTGVTAIDFEDLTRDASGNMYVGDFGNNLNLRTDLVIYKIPDPDTYGSDSVIPGAIRFHYPDQTEFPPSSSMMNFDCEAMVHYADSLYLFSKNRGISTWSRVYRLPDQPGNYTAELIDSFNTQHWVTGAAISPSGQHLLLLSESWVWLFGQFSQADFFGGSALHLSMETSQKEGVVFRDDSTVYISEDSETALPARLFRIDVSPWLSGDEWDEFTAPGINCYPNPCTDHFCVEFISAQQDLLRIDLMDADGRLLSCHQFRCDDQGSCLMIETASLSAGIYTLKVSGGHDPLPSWVRIIVR